MKVITGGCQGLELEATVLLDVLWPTKAFITVSKGVQTWMVLDSIPLPKPNYSCEPDLVGSELFLPITAH